MKEEIVIMSLTAEWSSILWCSLSCSWKDLKDVRTNQLFLGKSTLSVFTKNGNVHLLNNMTFDLLTLYSCKAMSSEIWHSGATISWRLWWLLGFWWLFGGCGNCGVVILNFSQIVKGLANVLCDGYVAESFTLEQLFCSMKLCSTLLDLKIWRMFLKWSMRKRDLA